MQGCKATIGDEGDVSIRIIKKQDKQLATSLDPVMLSIFAHRSDSSIHQSSMIYSLTNHLWIGL